MNLLAIDTATAACSVALSCDGEIIEEFVVAPQDHTKRVLPMVDQLMAQGQLSLNQLHAIAFTAGPGSFTGLRIGLGVVQGLAYGADLPVIPVSTLRTLAASAARLLALPEHCQIIPALDARMGEIYWASYAGTPTEFPVEPLVDDTIASPEAVVEQITALLPRHAHWVGVGNGWSVSAMDQLAMQAIRADFYPHAYDLAGLAVVYAARGEMVPVFAAQPRYIRNEVTWKKRTKIRSNGQSTEK